MIIKIEYEYKNVMRILIFWEIRGSAHEKRKSQYRKFFDFVHELHDYKL